LKNVSVFKFLLITLIKLVLISHCSENNFSLPDGAMTETSGHIKKKLIKNSLDWE